MVKKLLVILFGILAIGVGIFLIVSGNNMAKRCTAKASGTVIQIIEEKEENREAQESGATVYDTYIYTYFPVIEYNAGDKTIGQKYSIGSGNKDKYKVGDKVDVLYDPNKPEDYLIKGDEKSSNLFGGIFVAAGVVVALIGVIKKEF